MNNRNTCRKFSGAAAAAAVLAYAAENAYKIGGRNFSIAGTLSTAAFLFLLTGMIFIIVGLVSKTPRTVFAGGCLTCGHFMFDLIVSGSFTGFGGYSSVTNIYFISRFIILLSAAAFSYMAYKVTDGKLPENLRKYWPVPAVGVLVGDLFCATLLSMRSGRGVLYALFDFLRDLVWEDLYLFLLAALFFLLLRSFTLDEPPAKEKKPERKTAPQASAPKSRAKAAPPMSEKEIIEKLVKLKELKDEGIITEEEFTKKKREYLGMSGTSSKVL